MTVPPLWRHFLTHCTLPFFVEAFKVANEHPATHPRSCSQRKKASNEQVNLVSVHPPVNTVPMVSIREIACYLSMLEGGKVEDKLECKLTQRLPT